MKTEKSLVIESLIEKYKDNLTENNALNAIQELLKHRSSWDECRDWRNYTYPTIIHIIGYGYFILKLYHESADIIEEGLKNIEEDQEYAHVAKSQLYEILGRNYCYLLNKEKAIVAFRKMVYYDTFSISNVTYPSISLYSFRSISEYSVKDLENNTISLSSIFKFNDPVDSAYFPWIENALATESDNVNKIFLEAMREAYSGYRARCFVSERPLPNYRENTADSYDNIPPYLNTIMWAHYADYHKGFCAEYKIPSSAISAHPQEGYVVALHQLEYKDCMPFCTNLNFKQGFLTKNQRWEYEHEVRMLYYSINKCEDYPIISLDDCPTFKRDIPQRALKAIYIGYKCDMKEKIIEVVKTYQPQADIYQINISKNDIYSFIADKIYEGNKS